MIRCGICALLSCSLLFVSGCARSDDTPPIGSAITDLLHGDTEESWNTLSLFPAFGSEYADEEEPLEALLEALAAHLEDEGFTNVNISNQYSYTYTPEDREEGIATQTLVATISLTPSDEDTFFVNLTFQWDPDAEQLTYLSWYCSKDGYSHDGASLSVDHIFSDDVLQGSEDMLAGCGIEDEGKFLYYYENKVLRLRGSFWNLSVLANAVEEEDGFYYIEEDGGAYIFDMEEVPEVYPDSLGGLPVTHIGLNYGSSYDYLGIPGTVRKITGACLVPVTIFPESVEEINTMTFVQPDLTGTFFVFNPDVKLTLLYALDSYEKSGFEPDITIYCRSEEAFEELTEHFPDITVKNIDDYLDELTDKEAAILDEVAEGDYSDIEDLF